MNLDLAPISAQRLNLPCPQGEKNACAHIAVSVCSVILRNGRDVLCGGLVVNEDYIKRATERGVAFYDSKLASRRRETPEDKSVWFSPGVAVSEYAKRFERPWFTHWSVSGCVTHRMAVYGSTDGIPGVMPRLVDELWRGNVRALREHVDQALILTCRDYSRSIIMRDDGLWLYDSHGLTHSTLYYYDTLNALATHVLRLCGVTSEAEIAENLNQMNHPERRPIDCEFDATRADLTQFEIVVIEVRQ